MDLRKLSLNITEEEYRKIPCLSYSSLSRYDREGYSYVKDMHKPISTPSLVFGSMVDCYLTQGKQSFLDTYVVSEIEEPSDSLKTISAYLSNSIDANTLEDISDEDILMVADKMGYQTKWKVETRITKIREGITGYYNFYQANRDKIVVSRQDYEDATKASISILENDITRDYFGPMRRVGWKSYTQLQFVSNEFESNIQFKGMLDLVLVDEINKVIYPCDLKTSKDVYDFEDSFYKYRYYIQAAMYTQLLKDALAKEAIFDYEIAPYQFIVVDRTHFQPFVFEWKVTDYVLDKQGNKRKRWQELLVNLTKDIEGTDGIPTIWKDKIRDGKVILNNYSDEHKD